MSEKESGSGFNEEFRNEQYRKFLPLDRNERLPFLREKTAQLTDSPGVYLMKNAQNKIIYVGKAKNLRNRVTSYFRENSLSPLFPHKDHLPKVAKMVSFVFDYDFIVTATEYEALILECSLIKQHDPKYNILLKDDKGYYYIKISSGDYPKITVAMTKENDGAEYIGPYMSGFTVKQAVEEANRVFLLPTCSRSFPSELGKARPCLNFHIKQCMGLCRGKVTGQAYMATINEAIRYIKTGSAGSIERMTNEMNQAAENLDFELAATLRDRIKAIQKAATVSTQHIITGQPDTDVIAVASNGEFTCAAVLLYRGGRLYDKIVFFLGEDDNSMVEDFLSQYYSSKSGADIPREILLESDLAPKDTSLLTQFLKQRSGHAVSITAPQRGDNVKLVQMAKSNAGEFLSFKVGRTAKEIIALEELGKLLGLTETPIYIEAYDISNLASQSMVAGMVVFENGRPKKSAYKRFSIKTVAIQNDLACMREVLTRRFLRYTENTDNNDDDGFSRLPDLILLDGGQGQVNAVKPILSELGIDVPLFGMVKDNKHRTRAIAATGGEIMLSDKRAAFALITRIQDEVHRFAISYQRKVHNKRSFSSELTQIQGIGNKRAVKLIQTFKTHQELLNATRDELSKVLGSNETVLNALWGFLHPPENQDNEILDTEIQNN